MANQYEGTFVNLKKNTVKWEMWDVIVWSGLINGVPGVNDWSTVTIFINEKRLDNGKVIKGQIVFNYNNTFDKYHNPLGSYSSPLFENRFVPEDGTVEKITRGATVVKGECRVKMFKQMNDKNEERYALRFSWKYDKDLDTVQDTKFGADEDAVLNSPLPF